MKSLIITGIVFSFGTACQQESHKDRLVRANEGMCTTDTSQYPQATADKKGIVYLRGTMTADKGLKVYPDTVPVLAISTAKEETLRKSFHSK